MRRPYFQNVNAPLYVWPTNMELCKANGIIFLGMIDGLLEVVKEPLVDNFSLTIRD